MRFLIQVRADASTEAGKMPSEQLLADMTRYNEELAKAGVLLAGEGLHPSAKGARVKFAGRERIVRKGPFPANELIAGFWVFDVKSLQEAIDWVKRCPDPLPGSQAVIEIRQIYEEADFGPELTPELRQAEARLRAQMDAKNAKKK
ncbi:MAG TPA: YciI family protein [Polyangia bacterium]